MRRMVKPVVVAVLAVMVGASMVVGAPRRAHAASVGMTVTSIKVGQGDATLVKSGRHAMLIDAGRLSMGVRVAAYMRKQGIKTLDYVVATHPDADHIGGMSAVYGSLKVKTTLWSPVRSNTQTYKAFKRIVKNEKCKSVHPRTGTVYKLGKARVKVIYGGRSKATSTNDGSLIVQASYRKRKALFMADAPSALERRLVTKGLIKRAYVLKVGHHGSKYSTSYELVNRVKPKIALVSVGENDYGHPSKTVLKRLATAGCKLYRTDKAGNIVVRFYRSGRVRTSAKASPWSSGVGTGASGSTGTTVSPSDYVYVTAYGTKYHRSWCSTIAGSTTRNKLTVSAAEKQGYEPCKVCF